MSLPQGLDASQKEADFALKYVMLGRHLRRFELSLLVTGTQLPCLIKVTEQHWAFISSFLFSIFVFPLD